MLQHHMKSVLIHITENSRCITEHVSGAEWADKSDWRSRVVSESEKHEWREALSWKRNHRNRL